jgi:hypothetical protein
MVACQFVEHGVFITYAHKTAAKFRENINVQKSKRQSKNPPLFFFQG